MIGNIMNETRFAVLVRDLPEDVVLAVIDALEASRFITGDRYDNFAQARQVALSYCQRAPSPEAQTRAESPTASSV
jgi:hypothetical protein